MPNYCYNILTIRAKGETLEKAKRLTFGGSGTFSFNNCKPMPEPIRNTNSPNQIISESEYEARLLVDQTVERGTFFTRYLQTQAQVDELEKMYGAKDWYDWARINWGTKWDAGNVDNESEGDKIQVRFDTAWSPPEAWFVTLCEQFHNDPVTIVLEYIEEQQQFVGKFEFTFGELCHSEGTVCSVIKGSDTEVTYNSQYDCWVTDEGQPVNDDDVEEKVFY